MATETLPASSGPSSAWAGWPWVGGRPCGARSDDALAQGCDAGRRLLRRPRPEHETALGADPMGLSYRLEDYAAYRAAVGAATMSISPGGATPPGGRRRGIISARCWTPTVRPGVQLWTKNVGGALALGAGLLERLRAEGTTLTAQVTITGLAGSAWEPLTPADTVSRLGIWPGVLGGPEHHLAVRPDHSDGARGREVRAAGGRGGGAGCTARRDQPGRTGALPTGGPSPQRPAPRLGRRDARLRRRLDGTHGACAGRSRCRRRDQPGLLRGVVPPGRTGHRAAARRVRGLWLVYGALGQYPPVAVRRGSRPGCGCLRYFDVGNYGGWASCHRCTYCYAG